MKWTTINIRITNFSRLIELTRCLYVISNHPNEGCYLYDTSLGELTNRILYNANKSSKTIAVKPLSTNGGNKT